MSIRECFCLCLGITGGITLAFIALEVIRSPRPQKPRINHHQNN